MTTYDTDNEPITLGEPRVFTLTFPAGQMLYNNARDPISQAALIQNNYSTGAIVQYVEPSNVQGVTISGDEQFRDSDGNPYLLFGANLTVANIKYWHERAAECTRLEGVNNNLLRANQSLRHDINIIAERLRQEAVERDWCREYDNIVEELNGNMSEEHLLKREEDFDFTLTFRVNVNVSARDYDSASERVGNIGDEIQRIANRHTAYSMDFIDYEQD